MIWKPGIGPWLFAFAAKDDPKRDETQKDQGSSTKDKGLRTSFRFPI
jgi:hypothetical protein